MATYTTQEQLVEGLRKQLSSDRGKALKALQVLWDFQTESEKSGEHPDVRNGVGFSLYDSDILSSLYKQLNQIGSLSEKQIQVVMHLIPKYAGQLIQNSLSTGKIRKENGCYVW